MCDQHTEKNTLTTPCVEARRGGFVARICCVGGWWCVISCKHTESHTQMHTERGHDHEGDSERQPAKTG